jgi:hypothetical protein
MQPIFAALAQALFAKQNIWRVFETVTPQMCSGRQAVCFMNIARTTNSRALREDASRIRLGLSPGGDSRVRIIFMSCRERKRFGQHTGNGVRHNGWLKLKNGLKDRI